MWRGGGTAASVWGVGRGGGGGRGGRGAVGRTWEGSTA